MVVVAAARIGWILSCPFCFKHHLLSVPFLPLLFRHVIICFPSLKFACAVSITMLSQERISLWLPIKVVMMSTKRQRLAKGHY